MERNRRVYPAERSRDGWLSYLLLFLSAIVLVSGLAWRNDGGEITISPVATATPIPMDESFDETLVEQEFTLPSATWFALQLGAFENEEAARQMGEQFTRRGAAGFVWLDGRYRTLAAVYPLREDAQTVRGQLAEYHSVDTYLYEIDLPAIRLRLSGMRGQLEILEAAFGHANDLIAALQSISVTMDRQETNVTEAISQLSSLNAQIEAVSLRLKQRFSPPRHETVAGLIRCFDDFTAFFTQANPDDSVVTFGTKLKYQTLASLYLLQQVYDTLSHT